MWYVGCGVASDSDDVKEMHTCKAATRGNGEYMYYCYDVDARKAATNGK